MTRSRTDGWLPRVPFSYCFPYLSTPIVPELVTGEALVTISQDAEAAGFASVAFTEHPAPSEAWRNAGGHDAIDPFAAFGFIAGATTTLRMLTYLAVLPYRNPFLLARTVATVDHLSGGRVDLGLGVGYQKGEYRALGVDFEERNALFDEGLEVMKLAWTGEPVAYEGLHFSTRGTTLNLRPAQRPHPPIWLGGNSKLTLRRVAEHAQGWMPMRNSAATASTLRSPVLETVDDLVAKLDYLRSYADEIGRTEPIAYLYLLPDPDHDGWEAEHLETIARLRELGVEWFAVNGAGRTMAEVRAFIGRFREVVIDPASAA